MPPSRLTGDDHDRQRAALMLLAIPGGKVLVDGDGRLFLQRRVELAFGGAPIVVTPLFDPRVQAPRELPGNQIGGTS